MPRAVRTILLTVVLASCAVSLSADSRPALSGGVEGIELCPQSICGFALFVGSFEGELNSKPASGAFVGAITHGPLPPLPGGTAPITGGEWTITANQRVLEGEVTGGTILNITGTQFCVAMELEITKGGRGTLYSTVLLDHGPFPPIVVGGVSQTAIPCS